jgi:hypothetical protein
VIHNADLSASRPLQHTTSSAEAGRRYVFQQMNDKESAGITLRSPLVVSRHDILGVVACASGTGLGTISSGNNPDDHGGTLRATKETENSITECHDVVILTDSLGDRDMLVVSLAAANVRGVAGA